MEGIIPSNMKSTSFPVNIEPDVIQTSLSRVLLDIRAVTGDDADLGVVSWFLKKGKHLNRSMNGIRHGSFSLLFRNLIKQDALHYLMAGVCKCARGKRDN